MYGIFIYNLYIYVYIYIYVNYIYMEEIYILQQSKRQYKIYMTFVVLIIYCGASDKIRNIILLILSLIFVTNNTGQQNLIIFGTRGKNI
jgi:hypothetical protein